MSIYLWKTLGRSVEILWKLCGNSLNQVGKTLEDIKGSNKIRMSGLLDIDLGFLTLYGANPLMAITLEGYNPSPHRTLWKRTLSGKYRDNVKISRRFCI
jgi:hypothetical protein